MAAHYFDKILIQHVNDNVYSFEASSNLQAGYTQLNGTLSGKRLTYEIPQLTAANAPLKFNQVDIDFGDEASATVALIFPQFKALTDVKGTFQIKDSDFPPPDTRKLTKQKNRITSAFKIMALTGVSLGEFKFSRIQLTRIMDQTYQVEILLKHTNVNAKFVSAGYDLLPDKDRRVFVLVLAVKEDPVNGSNTVLFQKNDLYVSENTPVVIYNVGSGAMTDIDITTVVKKNAYFEFD